LAHSHSFLYILGPNLISILSSRTWPIFVLTATRRELEGESQKEPESTHRTEFWWTNFRPIGAGYRYGVYGSTKPHFGTEVLFIRSPKNRVPKTRGKLPKRWDNKLKPAPVLESF